MLLSERLKQDHDCGDYGQGLEGYSGHAKALEDINESLKMRLEDANNKLIKIEGYIREMEPFMLELERLKA